MIDRNERLLEAYRQFLFMRETIAIKVSPDKGAPYKWYKFPDKLSLLWIAYTNMLEEHAIGISNSINEFLRYINSLDAWGNIIKNKEENDKFEIIIEFITPIATLALSMPFVIRERFIYSAVHLSHQSNYTKGINWGDEVIIENDISFNTADKICFRWNAYNKFKMALEKIAYKKYREDTKDFRHKYHHRYSLGIELGNTEFIKKIGENRYSIGFTQPLKIGELIPILSEQHTNCLDAFKEYQNLVNEHISGIENYDKENVFNS